ncbi:MAG: restriction endonuclease subunit S, partial [Caldilineaceae bacterium]|nr:restriction endonuclease subunit S [Caldilineaceae bacterium]
MNQDSKWRAYSEYKASGIEWLREVPQHWVVGPLKFFCSESAIYGANESANNYSDAGVRFVRTSDIDDYGHLKNDGGVYLNESSVFDYLLQDGDLLLSRSGTIGRSFVYREDTHGKAAYAGYLVCFRLNRYLDPRFAFYFTKSVVFQDWLAVSVITSTIGNINGHKYANMPLPKPPLPEQRA